MAGVGIDQAKWAMRFLLLALVRCLVGYVTRCAHIQLLFSAI